MDYDQEIERRAHPENFEKTIDEDDEDEESAYWRQHDEEMKAMRERRRQQFERIFNSLELQGFTVRHLSPYCIRINECFDVYPSNKRWHDTRSGERGDLRMSLDKVEAFIKRKL